MDAIARLEGPGRKRAPAVVKEVLDALEGKRRGRRIRCPKCAWQPRAQDRWFCSKCGRGHWNTFDTRGRCPVCSYVWEWTICLRCHEWSRHADWYEEPPPSPT